MEKKTFINLRLKICREDIDFSTLKGKVMIVNTTSKCGLTPQYKDLEAIYKEYKDKIL
jgi:glutathione peroxidase